MGRLVTNGPWGRPSPQYTAITAQTVRVVSDDTTSNLVSSIIRQDDPDQPIIQEWQGPDDLPRLRARTDQHETFLNFVPDVANTRQVGTLARPFAEIHAALLAVGAITADSLVLTSAAGAGAAGAFGPEELQFETTQAATAGATIRNPGYVDWEARTWETTVGTSTVQAFGRFGAVIDTITAATGVPATYRLVWANTAGAIQWDADEAGNTLQQGTLSTTAIDINGGDLTELDEVSFADAAAGATAAGRLRRNATALTWHDGAAVLDVVGLSANGFAARTGAGAFAARTIAVAAGSAAALSVAGGDGSANPTFTVDAGLVSLAALAMAADLLPYTTADNVWASTALTAFARTVLDDADAVTARATLGVAIGVDVQAWDADLDSLAALDATAGYLVKIGAAAHARRTLTGTVNQVSISNPTGTVSNPVFSLPQDIHTGASPQFTGGLFTGDLRVQGNFAVEGSSTPISSEIVLIGDNHLYLNHGYETAVAQTGGLVANYLPLATNDTVAAGGFVAGVGGVSNPTVATAAAITFAVGQFIQISGATEEANNGLFEVLSHAVNVLTIRGVGLTATVEDFTQNNFVASAGAVGTIRRVTVSTLRAGTDGLWESAAGATTGLVFSDHERLVNKGAASGYASLDAGVKVPVAQISEVLAPADLTGVTATSGGGTTLVFNDTPTLLTPTIANFANAAHNHQAAAGGAQLDHGLAMVAASLLDDDHTQYALLAGRAGGQLLRGGTAAGDDLTLQSTADATRGTIFFGAVGALDEANVRFAVGDTTPNAYGAGAGNRSIEAQGTGAAAGDGGLFFASSNKGVPAAGDLGGGFLGVLVNNAGTAILSRMDMLAVGAGGVNGFGGEVLFQLKQNDAAAYSSLLRMIHDGASRIGVFGAAPVARAAAAADLKDALVAYGWLTDGGATPLALDGGTLSCGTSSQVGMGTGGTATFVGVANLNVTAVGNVDAGPDDLITYTLPANSMNANGKAVRIKAWGTTANNATAKTIRLDFGATAILTTSLTISVAGVWTIEAVVVRTGAAAQDAFAELRETGTGNSDMEITTPVADTTAGIVIRCVAVDVGLATNDIRQEGLLVEFIN